MHLDREGWMAKGLSCSPHTKNRARLGIAIAAVSVLVVAVFALVGLACQQDESLSSPGRSELSGAGGRDPEVSVATQEFDRSLREETAAKKELEEAEEAAPGWMSNFPSSVLRSTVGTIERAAAPHSFGDRPGQGGRDDTAPAQRADVASREHVPSGRGSRGRHQQHHDQQQESSPQSSSEPSRHSLDHGDAEKKHQRPTKEADNAMLRSLEARFSHAMDEARALKRRAALQRAEAKKATSNSPPSDSAARSGSGACGLTSCVEAMPASLAEEAKGGSAEGKIGGGGSKLDRQDQSLLGALFSQNTVLHTVKKDTGALKKLVNQQVRELTERVADTASQVAEADKKGGEKGGKGGEESIREADLKKQESLAATQQAAGQLLRILHTSKDPWLVKTMKQVALDAAKIKDDSGRIERIEMGGVDEPCSVEIRGLPKCATHREAAAQAKEREKLEAARLLQHTLDLAKAAKKREAERKRTKLPAAVARQVAAAAKIAQLGTTKAKIAALGKNGRNLGKNDRKLGGGKGGSSVEGIPSSWYSKEDARDGEGVGSGLGRGGAVARGSDETSGRAGSGGGGAGGGGGRSRGGLIGELGSDVVKDLSGLF